MSDLPQDKSTSDTVLNLCHHMCNITLEVGNGKIFLVDVSSIGATSKSTHCGQVPAVTTLRLNDKHSCLGSRRRLLDTAADLNTRRCQSGFAVINPFQLYKSLKYFRLSFHPALGCSTGVVKAGHSGRMKNHVLRPLR